MMCRMARGPWLSKISGRWYLASRAQVMAPDASWAVGHGDQSRPWALSWRSKSESMGSSLAL